MAINWIHRGRLAVQQAIDKNAWLSAAYAFFSGETPDALLPPRRREPVSGFPKWQDYRELFKIGPFEIAFLPIWRAEKGGILGIRNDPLAVRTENLRFQLPPEFPQIDLPPGVVNNPCCRVSATHVGEGNKLETVLSETSYGDYILSGEHLDDPIPSSPEMSYRARFGQLEWDARNNLRPFALTNICGVGLLLREDDLVLAVRHSEESHVYPSRWTFSSSGVMRWHRSQSHPLSSMILKAASELKHQIHPDQLRLAMFGVDARKLFFQFCWEERVKLDLDSIVGDAGLTYQKIAIDPNQIAEALVGDLWEPSAEAMLLGLGVERFGANAMVDALEKHAEAWHLREMRDEWDLRASQSGYLPDMSTRYPREDLGAASDAYVRWIMGEVTDEVAGKNVLEVGPGTGRITQPLLKVCQRLTCVDLSERMKTKCLARLGGLQGPVNFPVKFAQDYRGSHDVALAALVLIHNGPGMFEKLVDMMCTAAPTVITCDDVSDRTAGPHTFLRSPDLVAAAFAQRGMTLVRRSEHLLFSDHLILQVFRRSA